MNEGLLFPEVSYLQPLQELGPMYSSFLLQHYRQAPLQVKGSVLSALTTGSSRERAEQVIHGDVLGNVIKGNVTIGTGGIMNKNTKRR